MQQQNDEPEKALTREDVVDSTEIRNVEHEMGDKEMIGAEMGESSGNAGTLEVEENVENSKAADNKETVENKEMPANPETPQPAQSPEAMEVVAKSEATETPQPAQSSEENSVAAAAAAAAASAPDPAPAPASFLSPEDLTRLVHVKNYENQILLNELERVRQLYSTVPRLS